MESLERTLTNTLGDEQFERDAAPAGTRVGRYFLIEVLGHGGMGVVWSAYDPILDRKVALKLLLVQQGSSSAGGRLRARLVREAQAMARLAHANVVTVHDAGETDETAFIAMELVKGQTLREWLRVPRTPEAILEVFLRAGRGLEAAHHAGMIHRDFKPANVLMGDDGRVRVSDFGLVRLGEELPGQPLPPLSFTGSGALTVEGAVLGTPAFMAPEQLDGKLADARSDQFAFCVALYEALYGVHPFVPEEQLTVQVLSEKIRAGRFATPPAGHERRVPARVRALLERGMAVLPEDRHASMGELLAALEVTLRPRARRRLIAGALLVVVAAAVTTVALQRDRAAAVSPCANAAAALDATWTPARRQATRAAFAALGSPAADAAWARAEAALDARAARWRALRIETCEATRVRRSQPEAVMDARQRCLDRRLAELDAFLGAIDPPDVALAPHLVTAATALSPPEACAGIRVADDEPALPAELSARDEVTRVRGLVARARSLRLLRRQEPALAQAQAAQTQAAALAYPPVLAESLLELGNCQFEADAFDAARVTLHDAARAADSARDDAMRFEAWLALERVEERRARYPQGAEALANARAVLARLPPSDERDADLLYRSADLEGSQFHLRECVDGAARALGLYEKLGEPTQLKLASTLGMRAACLLRLEELDAAIADLERARVIVEQVYGHDHPDVATIFHQLGMAARKRRRFADADRYTEEALRIRVAVLGPEHTEVASSYNNIANLRVDEGRHAEALEYILKAMPIWERVYGRRSRAVGRSLSVAGHAERGRGRLAEAEAYYREALAIRLTYAESDPASVFSSQEDLGETLIAAGRTREGLAFLEEALRRAEAPGIEPGRRGTTRFTLAKALVATRRAPARALELARQARAELVAPGLDAERQEVDAFLAAHAGAAPVRRAP